MKKKKDTLLFHIQNSVFVIFFIYKNLAHSIKQLNSILWYKHSIFNQIISISGCLSSFKFAFFNNVFSRIRVHGPLFTDTKIVLSCVAKVQLLRSLGFLSGSDS